MENAIRAVEMWIAVCMLAAALGMWKHNMSELMLTENSLEQEIMNEHIIHVDKGGGISWRKHLDE